MARIFCFSVIDTLYFLSNKKSQERMIPQTEDQTSDQVVRGDPDHDQAENSPCEKVYAFWESLIPLGNLLNLPLILATVLFVGWGMWSERELSSEPAETG